MIQIVQYPNVRPEAVPTGIRSDLATPQYLPSEVDGVAGLGVLEVVADQHQLQYQEPGQQ